MLNNGVSGTRKRWDLNPYRDVYDWYISWANVKSLTEIKSIIVINYCVPLPFCDIHSWRISNTNKSSQSEETPLQTPTVIEKTVIKKRKEELKK